MNKLREEIEDLNELVSTNSSSLTGHFYTSDFNKVLDTIIAHIPETVKVNGFPNYDGKVFTNDNFIDAPIRRKDIISILQDAKVGK